MEIPKIIKSLDGIRKPISLGALAIVILYLLYQAILSLDIFKEIDDTKTFIVINNILMYVFIIALVTILLVFAERLLKTILNRKIDDEKQIIAETPKNQITLEIFVFVNDRIAFEVSSCQNLSLTFGETRRILSVISKLKDLSELYYLEIKNKLAENSISGLNSWYSHLKNFISEANIVFPLPEDHKYTISTERLKKYRYQTLNNWEEIKESLTNDSIIDLKRLKEIENDEDKKWTLQGFDDEKDYMEFISPTIDTLVKSASRTEIELLRDICDKKNFTEKELLDNGFDRGTIVETLNILMRSKLLQANYDNGTFHLGKVGQDIIKKEFSI
ncbi:hypothetical protein ABV409_11915 [Flagellimonas sp. DF-77]|uniref:hypothetical protein n=1 Tax=Flagellimonas algarum TaxID=3230298 RepID=UPI00339A770D